MQKQYNMDAVTRMAEFCLKYWNEINETDDSESQYVLSEELELCEGCGEWTHVIVSERSFYDKLIFHPLKILDKGICHLTCFFMKR